MNSTNHQAKAPPPSSMSRILGTLCAPLVLFPHSHHTPRLTSAACSQDYSTTVASGFSNMATTVAAGSCPFQTPQEVSILRKSMAPRLAGLTNGAPSSSFPLRTSGAPKAGRRTRRGRKGKKGRRSRGQRVRGQHPLLTQATQCRTEHSCGERIFKDPEPHLRAKHRSERKWVTKGRGAGTPQGCQDPLRNNDTRHPHLTSTATVRSTELLEKPRGHELYRERLL